MCLITFKDGVSIELHEDCTIDVIDLSLTDVEFNTIVCLGNDVQIFNAVNNRLGGCL